MAQSSEIKLLKRFDQDVEITGTLTVGGNTVLTGFTETDPTVPSYVKSITTTNISNWDTAYGWGNHADAGYLQSGNISTGRITIANNVSTGGFGSYNDFQILLYDTGTATRNYGIGIESDTFMFNSDSNYRFYVDNSLKVSINSSGNITANAFIGDGSLLTNISASTVGGLQANQFLRADANDEKSGWLKVYSTIGAGDNVRTGLAHYDNTPMGAGVGGQLVLGYLYITGAGNYTEGAIIKMFKENATSGHYGSGLKFQVRNHAEDLNTKMRLSPSGKLSLGDSPYNAGVHPFNTSIEEDVNWGFGVSWSGSTNTDYHTKLMYYPVTGENRAAGIWNSLQDKFSLYSDSNNTPNIIIPDGKLGVGVTNPYRKMQVDGHFGVRNGSFFIGDESGSTNDGLQFYKSGDTLRIYRDSGSFGGTSTATSVNIDLYSSTAYSTRIAGSGNSYFNNGANVGIGTSSPAYTLTVDGNIKINHGNNAAAYYLWLNKKEGQDGGILFQRDNNLDWQLVNYNTSGNLNLYSYGTSNSVLAVYRDTGNVSIPNSLGIGSSSFGYKLDVNGTARIGGYNSLTLNGVELKGYPNNSLWFISNNSGEAQFVVGTSWDWDRQVEFRYNPNTIGSPDGVLTIGQLQKNAATWTHGNIDFNTNGGFRMRLDNSGNLGIGAYPSTKLDVRQSDANTLISRVWNSGTGHAVMRIASSANVSNSARIEFSDNDYYNAVVSGDRTEGIIFRVGSGNDALQLPIRAQITQAGHFYFTQDLRNNGQAVGSDVLNIRGHSNGQYIRLMGGDNGFGIVDSNWSSTLHFRNMNSYGHIYHNGGQEVWIGNGTNHPLKLTGQLKLGVFSSSQTNSGDAWFGRASDRSAGSATIQLGTNTASKFEIVDYSWSNVLFEVNHIGDLYAKRTITSGANAIYSNTYYDSTGGRYLQPNGVSNIRDLYLRSNANFDIYDNTDSSYIHCDARSESDFSAAYKYAVRTGGGYGYYKEYWWDGNSYQSIAQIEDSFRFSAPVMSANNAYNNPDFLIPRAGDYNWAYGSYSNESNIYWMQVKFYGTGDDNRGFRVLDSNADVVRFRVNGAGTGYFTGDVLAYSSDARLKENVKNIDNAIDKVKSLNGVTFDWNDKAIDAGFIPKQRYNDAGVLAQEVQAVLPQAVDYAPFDQHEGKSKSGEDYLTVKYEKIVPLLIEAIKEQQKQIDELKAMIK